MSASVSSIFLLTKMSGEVNSTARFSQSRPTRWNSKSAMAPPVRMRGQNASWFCPASTSLFSGLSRFGVTSVTTSRVRNGKSRGP